MPELPDLDFDGLETFSVREAVAVPETGATSGSSSCTSTSCCGSRSCCSAGSCGRGETTEAGSTRSPPRSDPARGKRNYCSRVSKPWRVRGRAGVPLLHAR
ncbi:thiazolylpeptide-type bacteriocin [Curtobacterium aurantiacum]